MPATSLPPPPATAPDRTTQSKAVFSPAVGAFLAWVVELFTVLDAWVDELAQLATGALKGSSADSVTIGTGAKSFPNASTGRAWIGGSFLLVSSDADPANYMLGTVTSYNAVTGALAIDVASGNTGGTGTFDDWSIAPAIDASAINAASIGFTPTSEISATDAQAAIEEVAAEAKRRQPRVQTAVATSGTLTPDCDTASVFKATGLTGAVHIDLPDGTPADFQKLEIYLADDSTSRAITKDALLVAASGVTIPTATTANKWQRWLMEYNDDYSRWDVVAVAHQA